jgi:hypothetical protein
MFYVSNVGADRPLNQGFVQFSRNDDFVKDSKNNCRLGQCPTLYKTVTGQVNRREAFAAYVPKPRVAALHLGHRAIAAAASASL